MSEDEADETLDWSRVSRDLASRMEELGFSQTELAQRAGVNPITLRKLRSGGPNRYRLRTLASISRALGWRPDGLIRIARGYQPLLIEASDMQAPAPAPPDDPKFAALAGSWDGLADSDKDFVLTLVDRLKAG